MVYRAHGATTISRCSAGRLQVAFVCSMNYFLGIIHDFTYLSLLMHVPINLAKVRDGDIKRAARVHIQNFLTVMQTCFLAILPWGSTPSRRAACEVANNDISHIAFNTTCPKTVIYCGLLVVVVTNRAKSSSLS